MRRPLALVTTAPEPEDVFVEMMVDQARVLIDDVRRMPERVEARAEAARTTGATRLGVGLSSLRAVAAVASVPVERAVAAVARSVPGAVPDAEPVASGLASAAVSDVIPERRLNKMSALLEMVRDGRAALAERMSERDDPGIWSFAGAAGQVVRITAGSDAFDTVVRLLSPSGEELGRGSGSLDTTLPAAGRYQVRATSVGDGAGPYQVAVRAVPVRAVPVMQLELDAAPAAGEVGEDGAAQHWSFAGAAGQVVRITAGSDAFDTVVRLLSPSGEELGRNDDGGFGTDSRLETILSADGRYQIQVTAYSGTGPYQVAVRAVPVMQLELDAAPAAGEVGEDGAAQHWSFAGAAGQVVRITAGSDAFDTVVRLLSPSGEELGRGSGSLDATLPAAGRYQVRATSVGDGAGPYQVAVRAVPVRAVPVMQLELDAAPAAGEVSEDGAAQHWSFAGAAGQVVRITAGSDAFDTVVRLLSPSGEELGRNDDGGFGTDSRLETILSADGRYQIQVTAYSGTGPYQVAVRAVPVMQLELDAAPAAGEVGEDGAAQHWSFAGAAGQVVRITAGSDAFDTVVRLLSPSGEELGRGSGSLDATLPAAGRYQVRATSVGDGAGPYQVAVRAVPVMQLELDAAPAAGEVSEDGAAQHWSFAGAAGQVVRITAGSDAFDTVVRLLSPSGEELGRNDDGGFGTDSRLETILSADGRYQIQVTAYSGTGPYQVAVRAAPVMQLELDAAPVTSFLVR